jgi:hypothetical protein
MSVCPKVVQLIGVTPLSNSYVGLSESSPTHRCYTDELYSFSLSVRSCLSNFVGPRPSGHRQLRELVLTPTASPQSIGVLPHTNIGPDHFSELASGHWPSLIGVLPMSYDHSRSVRNADTLVGGPPPAAAGLGGHFL